MTRHITLLLLLSGVVGCDAPTNRHKPVTIDSVAGGTQTPAASVAPAATSSPKPPAVAGTHVWTVLPYSVTDGMEYGPSQVVLDEHGNKRLVQLAALPERKGYSRLVRVSDNGPKPSKYDGLADFVWPNWKVVDVLAERKEDPTTNWDAPVVSASVSHKPSCVEVTLHVFEGHTFCSGLGSATQPSVLVFVPPSFYPFPAGAVSVVAVPDLPPVRQR